MLDIPANIEHFRFMLQYFSDFIERVREQFPFLLIVTFRIKMLFYTGKFLGKVFTSVP